MTLFYEQPWFWKSSEFDPDYESSRQRACCVEDIDQALSSMEDANEQGVYPA